jgi:phosphatidate phosphatase APP1
MTAQTSAQIAANWAQRLGASSDKMTAGVNAVTVAPGQAAARQKSVYLQNVQAAADKWAKNVSAVPLSDWQQAYITKGIPRIASGATAAQSKMQNFMDKLLPFQSQALSALPARGTYEQNKNRATMWMDKMHSFSYKSGA